MGLDAGQQAVQGSARFAIRVVAGVAVATTVADRKRIAGCRSRGRAAERQADQQQLQNKRARYRKADQRPSDQTPCLLLLVHANPHGRCSIEDAGLQCDHRLCGRVKSALLSA